MPHALGIASGEEWLAVRGFRHTEGSEFPVCWTEVYINREFAAVGRLLQRHTGPIFHLIEDLFGQSIVEVHQEIAAALISPALAGGLKVKAGTTALEVQRTYKLADRKDRAGRDQHASRFPIPPLDDDAAREGIVRPPRRPTNRRTQRVNGGYVLTRPNSNRRCFHSEF